MPIYSPIYPTSQWTFNVIDDGNAKMDGTGDIGAIINRAFASGAGTVLVPAIPAGYRLTTSIQPTANYQQLIGINGTPLIKRANSTNVDMFTSAAKTELHLENFLFEGNSAGGGTGKGIYSHISDRNKYWNLKFQNMSDACIMNYQGSNVSIRNIYGTGGTNHLIYLDTHLRGNIRDILTDSIGGFTCFGNIGAHYNHFHNVRTVGTSLLELITVDGNYNKITDCMATGTRDNGITLVGDYNELCGFHSFNNYHNGLMINGNYNMVSNLVAWNNNQRDAGAGVHSGLKIESGFGGKATGNQICNVQMYDDQGSPTQNGGITLGANGYNQWVSGATLPASNYFVYYGNNAYTADGGSGVMGTTAPTHTSGSVVNGAVTLRFLFTTAVGFHATDNLCTNIKYRNNKTANKIDNATLGTNSGF